MPIALAAVAVWFASIRLETAAQLSVRESAFIGHLLLSAAWFGFATRDLDRDRNTSSRLQNLLAFLFIKGGLIVLGVTSVLIANAFGLQASGASRWLGLMALPGLMALTYLAHGYRSADPAPLEDDEWFDEDFVSFYDLPPDEQLAAIRAEESEAPEAVASTDDATDEQSSFVDKLAWTARFYALWVLPTAVILTATVVYSDAARSIITSGNWPDYSPDYIATGVPVLARIAAVVLLFPAGLAGSIMAALGVVFGMIKLRNIFADRNAKIAASRFLSDAQCALYAVLVVRAEAHFHRPRRVPNAVSATWSFIAIAVTAFAGLAWLMSLAAPGELSAFGGAFFQELRSQGYEWAIYLDRVGWFELALLIAISTAGWVVAALPFLLWPGLRAQRYRLGPKGPREADLFEINQWLRQEILAGKINSEADFDPDRVARQGFRAETATQMRFALVIAATALLIGALERLDYRMFTDQGVLVARPWTQEAELRPYSDVAAIETECAVDQDDDDRIDLSYTLVFTDGHRVALIEPFAAPHATRYLLANQFADWERLDAQVRAAGATSQPRRRHFPLFFNEETPFDALECFQLFLDWSDANTADRAVRMLRRE